MFVWVFSLLLIPVLLMVCTLAWGRTSDKGRPYPMKAAFGASCCSVSANLILLVLIAIGAVVASDFCAVRREFVDYQVQGVNFTVGWDQVYVSDTFDDVLDCPVVDPRTAATYPWWRYDNNFIDIWGVGELFDISDEIAGLIAALNAAVTAIRPIDYDELALLGQGIPQSDPTAGLVTARGDLATYAREVEELADYVSSFSQPVQDKVASLAGYVDSLQGRMDALDAIAAETPGVRAQFEHEVATEAAGVSDDAIDDLQDTISALEEVARLTYETRNYALCGFVGGFWRDTVETTICYELEPTLNGATTGIFLTILATLVAFLWWLRLFVRAKLIARDAQKEIEGRGGASEAKSDAKAEAKATKAKPKQKKFGVFKARPGSMAAQMELAMQREANAV
uniref:Uncharacterized protein n=2 Tax=Phaeomonas parva TaxID=124430 RepID=A0A7S1TPX2_9STRA|mmetsp:Transcript_12392/g.37200  ORF Transcript_12392/g.37200 Transcript_12392/m.37200 type:complete len:397 (+) Transcript_12392:1420-2610(+)